jgi:hypothetical protein
MSVSNQAFQFPFKPGEESYHIMSSVAVVVNSMTGKRFCSKLNPRSKFCSDIFAPYMGGSPQLWTKFEVVLWNTLGAQWVRWICHSCALAR